MTHRWDFWYLIICYVLYPIIYFGACYITKNEEMRKDDFTFQITWITCPFILLAFVFYGIAAILGILVIGLFSAWLKLIKYFENKFKNNT